MKANTEATEEDRLQEPELTGQMTCISPPIIAFYLPCVDVALGQ